MFEAGRLAGRLPDDLENASRVGVAGRLDTVNGPPPAVQTVPLYPPLEKTA